jgi:FkbM family methyltransferase
MYFLETPGRNQSYMNSNIGKNQIKEHGFYKNYDGVWLEWMFGDWDNLKKIDLSDIQDRPERAEFALLAATGWLESGNQEAARFLLRAAYDWQISKDLLKKFLVSSQHSSIGRAYLAIGEIDKAKKQFEAALSTVKSDLDHSLIAEARAVRESIRMGLLPQAGKLMSGQLNVAKANHENNSFQNELKILQTEVDLLHHELSLAQQRQQLHKLSPENQKQFQWGSVEWKEELAKKSMAQLGQDLWVLERTGYKRGGFFVEFGATDGVLLSNTWLLEKEFEWQGICAEPNPKFYSQLQRNRGCKLSSQCIGGQTGKEVEFIFADAYGGIQEYAADDQHKEKREAYRAAGCTAQLTTISLHDFLTEHKAPKDIDYLSIDTEGSEYEILKYFPFDQWNIQLLNIEHNFTKCREDILSLLEKNGYQYQEAQWDIFFYKSN